MILLRIVLFPVKLPCFLFLFVCMPFMVTLDLITSPSSDRWDELWLQEFRKALSIF